jgi:hypothetical protein
MAMVYDDYGNLYDDGFAGGDVDSQEGYENNIDWYNVGDEGGAGGDSVVSGVDRDAAASEWFGSTVTDTTSAIDSALRKMGYTGKPITDKDVALAGLGLGGLAGWLGGNTATRSPSGYQGGIPQLAVARAQVPQPTTPREYGAPAMGRRYFTDTQFVAPSGLAAAQAAADQQAQQIAAQQQPVQAAHGGLMHAAKGRYLRGASDGMADQLRTSIDGKQPAALSHGEFVVPADVVSHLGNGNSDAGAKKLYQMMDRVRQARTGTKKQGKQINPNKFMPGGLAQTKAYATGGDVTGSAINAGLTGTESNLSNWAGPYVTNMLGQGAALANAPYQAYTGQLTAGTAPLQQQAFNQASNLQVPAGMTGSYTPVTSDFSSQAASQYMNPYLQMSLAPQLAELQRQNQIANMGVNAKLTQAGGFGGGRQAVYNAENQRNMMSQMANTLGQGYNQAWNQAQQQFNADQARKMQEAQFGSTFGLQGAQAQQQANLANLNAMAGLGAQQRGIEQEGLTAAQNEFNVQRENPYKMVQFQQSLLNGLPLAAQNYNVAQPSALQSILGGASGIAGLLRAFGYNIPGLTTTDKTTTTAATPTTAAT